MRHRFPDTYVRQCPFCDTEIELDTTEISFDCPTFVKCPLCNNSVRYTDDYGMLVTTVKTKYGEWIEDED